MFRKKEHDTPRELRAYKYAIFPEEIPEDLWSLARRMSATARSQLSASPAASILPSNSSRSLAALCASASSIAA